MKTTHETIATTHEAIDAAAACTSAAIENPLVACVVVTFTGPAHDGLRQPRQHTIEPRRAVWHMLAILMDAMRGLYGAGTTITFEARTRRGDILWEEALQPGVLPGTARVLDALEFVEEFTACTNRCR